MNKMSLIVKYALIASLVLAIVSCGGPPPFASPKFPERVLHHIDDLADDLDLTADQQQKYEGIRARLKTDMEVELTSRRSFMTRIRKELEKDKPNMASLSGETKNYFSDNPASINRKVDYFMEFYNILDEQQQEKVIKKMRYKTKRWNFND